MTGDKARHVFEHNIMEARWKSVVGGRELLGNSFSRNHNLWFGSGPVRITVDTFKLRRHNRVIPLDGELVHALTSNFSKPDNFRDRTGNWSAGNRYHNEQLREEFVVGNIEPLSRVIERIEIRQGIRIMPVVEATLDYCERHRIPLLCSDTVLRDVDLIAQSWAEDDTPTDLPDRLHSYLNK